MKKINTLILAGLMGFVGLTETGCFGSFTLTKKVYKFHNEKFKNKIVKNILFWIAGHAVYGFTGTVDIFILNVIEFWTGSNPLAMAEGTFEIRVVNDENGNQFQIKASRNKFEVMQLSGSEKGRMASLSFNPENRKWTASAAGVSIDVAEMLASNGEYTGIKYLSSEGSEKVQYFSASEKADWSGLFQHANDRMASAN